MKTRRYFHTLLASVMLAATAGLTVACTDNYDNSVDVSGGTVGTVITEGALDVVHGRIVYGINADSLDNYRLPLATLQDVDIQPVKRSDSYGFRVETIDGKQYLTPSAQQEQTKVIEDAIVKISPKQHPELSRHIFIVFYKPSLYEAHNTSLTSGASDGTELVGSYSNIIGSSTFRWGEVGKHKSTIFDYNKIVELGKNNSTIIKATYAVGTSMLELAGKDIEETKSEWAVNAGVSWKQPSKHRLKVNDNGVIERVLRKETAPKKTWSGSVNLGFNGSSDAYANHEWYMNLLLVKTRTVKMSMDRYEYNDDGTLPDFETLCKITNPDFINRLTADTTKFDPQSFFDSWGTDVITQGTFGGMNIYLYGRTENAYENSVGFDAAASLSKTTVNSTLPNAGQFLQIFQLKGSPYWSVSADATYQNDHYEEATNSVKYIKTIGGNTSSDPVKWEGEMESSPGSWQIISYRTGTEEDSTVCSLYPIEQVGQDLAAGYLSYPDKNHLEELQLTSLDSAAAKRILANSNKLYEYKDEYLEKHAEKKAERRRIVLADVIMLLGKSGHKNEDVKPKIMKDPRHDNKYRIYYPMMAGKYAPIDNGYAFETSQDKYQVTADMKDQYWYYSLDRSDQCDGIVDIKFEYYKKSPGDGWTARGDWSGKSMNIAFCNDACIWVKWAESTTAAKDKITAFGVYKKNNKDAEHIFACTEGAGLKRNPTVGEITDFKNWWNDNEYTTWSNDDWSDGWVTYQNRLCPVFSKKTLPISRINEETIIHPLEW